VNALRPVPRWSSIGSVARQIIGGARSICSDWVSLYASITYVGGRPTIFCTHSGYYLSLSPADRLGYIIISEPNASKLSIKTLVD